MLLLRPLVPLDSLPRDAVLVVAFDGWTDAGLGGTLAATQLGEQHPSERVATFPSDALYDYRDRRPQLHIDRGRLGRTQWPELDLFLVRPPVGPPLLLLTGPEPDLAWRGLTEDVIELCRAAGVTRYVGLGSVPGPVPHTRPVLMVCTSSDPELLERLGAPHEQMVVPASCQVALEAALADAGISTLGLWVRIPHYVAGPYPEASRALLERLDAVHGVPSDLSSFDADIAANRARLDVASAASDEVVDHVRQLERLYDAELAGAGGSARGGIAAPITEADVPSADELAAEIERFLRGRGGPSAG
jgi:hypothetical protein